LSFAATDISFRCHRIASFPFYQKGYGIATREVEMEMLSAEIVQLAVLLATCIGLLLVLRS